MRHPLLAAGVAALLLAGAAAVRAAAPATVAVDPGRAVRLFLSDGAEYAGRVVAADDATVVLVTPSGVRVEIPRRLLASWRPEGERTGGAFGHLPRDPHASRLFFAPTARTLPAGDGYFADYMVFVPFVAQGVTDAVTIAAGVSAIPGLDTQAFAVMPKVRLHHGERLDLAVGGIYGGVFGESEDVALGYAVATYGTEDRAVTLAAGWGFGQGGDAAIGLVGGERRLGARWKLLGECWVIPEAIAENGLVVPTVLGVRFFGSRMAVDFGGAFVLGQGVEGFPVLPWVDFAISW